MTTAETKEATAIDAKRAAEFLRDEVMTVVRAELSKPWKQMKEDEQEWAASRIEFICKQSIDKVCAAIASAGPMSIGATMGKLGTDKNRNAVVPITFNGNLEDKEKLGIWNHIGRGITVILLDPEEYKTIEKPAQVDKDQPTIPGTDKQPDWPKVAEAIRDERPDVVDVNSLPDLTTPDAEDAGDVGEEIEAPAAEVDSLLDEEMSPDELAKVVNIPNPVKETKKKK